MTKKYNLELFVILIMLFFIPVGANAVPLGSVTINWHNMGDERTPNAVIFYTSLASNNMTGSDGLNVEGVGGSFPSPTFAPFFSRVISPSDIGFTFAINSSNYAYWDNMVKYVLTDGFQDLVAYDMGSLDTPAIPFIWSFLQNYIGNGIDFQGYKIDNLLLTIDDLYTSGYYRDDPVNGYYRWEATWTLTVDGQPAPVPEPTTLFLLAAGALGLAGLRKKQIDNFVSLSSLNGRRSYLKNELKYLTTNCAVKQIIWIKLLTLKIAELNLKGYT